MFFKERLTSVFFCKVTVRFKQYICENALLKVMSFLEALGFPPNREVDRTGYRINIKNIIVKIHSLSKYM